MVDTALSASVSDVLDNYADAIEGGNSYAGGTEYKGICSYSSFSLGNAAGNTSAEYLLTATGGTTSTIVVANASAYPDWLSSTDRPPFFALAVNGNNAGAARRITAINTTTNTFTVSPVFPYTVAASNSLYLLEGFKRLPDTFDPRSDEADSLAFERYFHLSCGAGRMLPWHGNGTHTFETTLTLNILLAKKQRVRRMSYNALLFSHIFREFLPKGEHRNSGNLLGVTVLYLNPYESEDTIRETENRIIIEDTYRMAYRVSSVLI
jgi:hypothetical protein